MSHLKKYVVLGELGGTESQKGERGMGGAIYLGLTPRWRWVEI